eukprot:TRINITY_DN16885_c1_g1_i2.p1 TRINITY_DN16885_c1_g1~~TRINITY_DN16885_c1_g1_i2.p1  ORF type:complete len:138 (+),score=1.66 TRINITY_DN16885_c1_g1_i2:383-796(+)
MLHLTILPFWSLEMKITLQRLTIALRHPYCHYLFSLLYWATGPRVIIGIIFLITSFKKSTALEGRRNRSPSSINIPLIHLHQLYMVQESSTEVFIWHNFFDWLNMLDFVKIFIPTHQLGSLCELLRYNAENQYSDHK